MKELSPEMRLWLRMQLLPDRVEARIEEAAIEAGALCNLRCPFCPTGNGTLALSREFLKLADFKAMLDALGPGLKRLTLHDWGESLLNPDIYEMIAEAAGRGIRTEISANFSLPPPYFSFERAERLVRSGLGQLMVAFGGVTQETYQLYRVGGDLDLVLSNIRLLLEAKRRLSSAHPDVFWLFHVHRQNQKDMPRARELAAELGIEVLFRTLIVPEEARDAWAIPPPQAADAADESEIQPIVPGSPCMNVWGMPVIHSDGSVLPCCRANEPRYSLGNIRDQPIGVLWNKPLAMAMRRYLRTGAGSETKLPCLGCPYDPWKGRSGSEGRHDP